MAKTVEEKRGYFHAKQDELVKAFAMASDGLPANQFDFSRADVLKHLEASDETDAIKKVNARNDELDGLGIELRNEEVKHVHTRIAERNAELATPAQGSIQHPQTAQGGRKSLGNLFVDSEQWKKSKEGKVDIPLNLDIELKTLMTTTAGFPPESVRSGLLVEGVTRPIQVTDLIPSFPINQSSLVYMEETTRTHAAAEKAEGAAYAESTFEWTQRTSPVQKITDSVPITDEQLEDEMQVMSLIDQRLSFGLRQRLDLQILVGNGTAPNLRGVNNVVGIQTQAKGTDDRISAFAKALTLIRVTGRSTPDGAVFHPSDWLAFMLMKNANGDFLFGNPFQTGGPRSLLGIPIAESDAQTENTGLIGDWSNFSRLDDRRGVVVQTGFVNAQFAEGKVTMRADMRAAFTVTRPAAFCTLTGI